MKNKKVMETKIKWSEYRQHETIIEDVKEPHTTRTKRTRRTRRTSGGINLFDAILALLFVNWLNRN